MEIASPNFMDFYEGRIRLMLTFVPEISKEDCLTNILKVIAAENEEKGYDQDESDSIIGFAQVRFDEAWKRANEIKQNN